jgi:Protein of unknown function (DUF3405)
VWLTCVPTRSVILLLNHFHDRHLVDLYNTLARECSGQHDIYLLSDRTRAGIRFARLPAEVKEFRFVLNDLIALGYPGKQDIILPGTKVRSVNLGNAELPVLLFRAEHHHYRHYWIVEYDVRFSGRWQHFFSAFDGTGADLLGTSLIRYADFPAWSHWGSLVIPGSTDDDERLRGFFPVYRITDDALGCLDERYRAHCAGHMETLVPTLVHRAGLRLEDIGGDGEFVAPSNVNRFYTNRRLTNGLSPGSFVFRPSRTAPGHEPNMLWHPVKPGTPFALRLANRLLRELTRG